VPQSTQPAPDMGLPRYLTLAEVANLARCDPKTVRRAIHDGKLRAFRRAKLLIPEADAVEWIEAHPAACPSVPRPVQLSSHRSGRGHQRATLSALRAIDHGGSP
jgi:excisionase family DNA binding protein